MDKLQKIHKKIQKDNTSEPNDYRETQSPTAHTHKKIKKIKKIEDVTDITFEELADKVEEFVPNTRRALQIMLAVATSGCRKDKIMLWMLFVGSPSSGKTELVELINRSPEVFSTDSFTMNSFISGERIKKSEKLYDLLPQLNKKCFVIKDWTTLFTLNKDATRKAIGDLVGIYDGSYAKFSPSRGNVVYNSNFSHLGCITPATLNKHTQYLNMVGARFLFYSIPELTEKQEEKSFKSIFNNKEKRSKTKRRLVRLGSKFINKLNNSSFNINKFNKKTIKYLTIASRFIARARGIVIIKSTSFINDEKEKITYYEPLDVQVEQPWRAVQQLMTLSKYLAFVVGKDKVTDEELEIVKDITLSSMPADRARAMNVFRKRKVSEISAKELSEGSDQSVKTARRLLEELVHLGILEKDKGAGQMAANYKIKSIFQDFVLVRPSDFLSAYNKTKEAQEFFDI